MGKGKGGGGLRILPHKSWHVWNYDNQQKVKKDEVRSWWSLIFADFILGGAC